jgi:phosphatidate phosphatase APP1
MSKSFPVLLLSSISSILVANVAVTQAPSQVPNIEGNWKMSIIGEDFAPTYTLVQKGNNLTGTFRAPIGNLPITGTVTKDKKFTFAAKSGGMSLNFVGTVDGTKMKGVADIPMKGRKNWTATR